MSKTQEDLRSMVLKQETFPDDLDLLVINDASETCIKIQAAKRKVDYMIIHYTDEEKRVQVRGRYCGDLPKLYIHGPPDQDVPLIVPQRFLDIPLFIPEKNDLCKVLNLHANGKRSGWITVKKRLLECGYSIEEGRKNNKRYAIIRR